MVSDDGVQLVWNLFFKKEEGGIKEFLILVLIKKWKSTVYVLCSHFGYKISN